METAQETEKKPMTINEFYLLQSCRPDPRACERFWTGKCGKTALTVAVYALGIPNAPRNPEKCGQCKRFRNFHLLVELAECDYEIEQSGRGYTCRRGVYLDDGYGFHFTADVEITVDSNGEAKKITADGYTVKQASALFEKAMNTCKLWKKKSKCLNSEDPDTAVSFDSVEEGEAGECGDCKYAEMVSSLLERLDDGAW